MKERINSNIKSYFVRSTFYVLLLGLAVCVIPLALAQRNAAKPKSGQVRQREQSISEKGRALPANVIVITNTNDSGSGSLRDALAAANDGDTINATSVSGTILLTSGQLVIIHDVTINGPGAENLAVNGNATFRVFENYAPNITISGFTITNGLSPSSKSGGGILNHGGLTLSDSVVSNSVTSAGNGGGISCDAGGTLTVMDSTISGNVALQQFSGGVGGGLSVDGGTVTVNNSTISNNSGSCAGGGIATNNAQLTVTNSEISGNGVGSLLACLGTGGGISSSGGTLTVTNSTISGNGGGLGGGGISADGMVTVSNSTINGNTGACSGGGISFGNGQLTVMSSTITGNVSGGLPGICEAGTGGGISANGGTLTVTNSTISGNSAGGNGGGGGGIACGGGTLTVTNDTISDNEGGGIHNFQGAAQIGDSVLNAGEFGATIFNKGGTVTSFGYNLASDDGGGVLTGPGDQINTDPMLGALQDNGGPTFTHALLPGSPAIDAGNPSFTPPPSFDQRGSPFHRVFNGHIDIGSFEVQPVRATPTPRPRPTPAPRP
jgi:hypothetical protein